MAQVLARHGGEREKGWEKLRETEAHSIDERAQHPNKRPVSLKHCHPPTQASVKAQAPPALVQIGEVGVPENPALQVTDVQLPAAAFVAVPVQPYPVGATQAAA